MKPQLLSIISTALLLISCGQSNEEKAKIMAAEYLKTQITHFDSYEPLVTKVDSLFYSPEKYNEALDMLTEFSQMLSKAQECTSKIRNAEEEMYVYKPINIPGYKSEPGSMYKQAVAEKENQEILRQKFIDNATELFNILRKNIQTKSSTEFQGWIVYQKFKALNNAGTTPLMDEYDFICDKEFKNCVGYPEENFSTGNKILNILQDNDDADAFLEMMIKQVSI